ncbi:MAG: transposase, partial [Acidobacteriota bacterium]
MLATPGRPSLQTESRSITTSSGPRELEVPHGRLIDANGTSSEFQSELLPRYARLTREVDEAILGVYLAGGNARRVRNALAPLLGSANLSKSAISRVVTRLKDRFAQWQQRDLSEEWYAVLFLDGFHLKVRLARLVVSAPVLAVLGEQEDGTKVLISLELAA